MRIPRLPWEKYWMMMAHLTATRSTCDRGPELLFDPGRHGVGAVLVKDKRAIAGGYNGSAPGHVQCNEIKCVSRSYEVQLDYTAGRPGCGWYNDHPQFTPEGTLLANRCIVCGGRLDGGHLLRDGHCVPGDTVISKFQPGLYNTGHRTILQIYENWQNPHKRGAMKRMKIRSVNEQEFVVPDRITDVWMSPPKRLLAITTSLGRTVRVTEKQLVLTEDGWEPADSLRVTRSKIALNGQYPYDDQEWLKQQYVALGLSQVDIANAVGCNRKTIHDRLQSFGIQIRDFHLGGWNKGMRREGTPGYKGEDIDDTHARGRSRRYGLTEACAVCGGVDGLEVHHRDGIPQNDADDNLLTLCTGCHEVAHTPHAKSKKVVFDNVASVDEDVEEEVFDLSTLHNHNYVGDGVVLHNCVRTIHSEMNALMQCALDGTSPQGSVLYTTASPCFDCAKTIIRAGIVRVCYGQPYDSRYGLSRDVKDMLTRSGLAVEQLIVTREDLER